MFKSVITVLATLCTICIMLGCSSDAPSENIPDNINTEASDGPPADATQNQQVNAPPQNEEAEAYDAIKLNHVFCIVAIEYVHTDNKPITSWVL